MHSQQAFDEKWDIAAAVSYVVERGYKRVTLQFPDELLQDAPLVADVLQRRLAPVPDAQVYILADTTYNPMSVDEVAAEHVNADCVIHYGAASLGPVTRVPAFCVLPRAALDVPAAAQLLAGVLGDAGASTSAADLAAAVVLFDQGVAHAMAQLQAALHAAYDGPLQLVFGRLASRVLDPAADSMRCCHAAGMPPANGCAGAGCAAAAAGADTAPVAVTPAGCSRQQAGVVEGAAACSVVGSSDAAGCRACGDSAPAAAAASTPAEAELTGQPLPASSPTAGEPGGVGSAAHATPRLPGDEAATAVPSASGRHPLCGLTWQLPPRVAPSRCLWLWLGPADSPCLRVLQLTLNGCEWRVVTPGAESAVAHGLSLETQRLLKRRYYLVEKARGASIIGILVGTLATAGYLRMLQRVKQLARQAGKHTYTMLMGRPNPAKLGNFPEVEVWVHVADPLALLLDSKDYLAPLITPYEALLAFTGLPLDYSQYQLDYMSLLSEESDAGASISTADNSEGGAGQDLVALPGLELAQRMPGLQLGSTGGTAGREVAARNAAEYLQLKRSYKGLETPATGAQVLAPHAAAEGRSGRAAGYADEPKATSSSGALPWHVRP